MQSRPLETRCPRSSSTWRRIDGRCRSGRIQWSGARTCRPTVCSAENPSDRTTMSWLSNRQASSGRHEAGCPTTRPPASARARTRDANRPALTWRARAHPPTFDAGLLTSGCGQIAAEGLEHLDPRRCEVCRCCSDFSTFEESIADAPRKAESSSPGTRVESFRGDVRRSRSPSGSRLEIAAPRGPRHESKCPSASRRSRHDRE